jgi:hypothetical protein
MQKPGQGVSLNTQNPQQKPLFQGVICPPSIDPTECRPLLKSKTIVGYKSIVGNNTTDRIPECRHYWKIFKLSEKDHCDQDGVYGSQSEPAD